MRHAHAAEHVTRLDGGTVYEVCACGATRVSRPTDRPSELRWHTCVLCTHPWGRA